MKIELQYPYNERWKSGYLQKNSENRMNVILFNSSDDRSSTSYARYLMSVYLGRHLSVEEQVDHINNDKTDDRIENFQILTIKENNAKEGERRKSVCNIICDYCNCVFLRERRQMHKGNKNNFCSIVCRNAFIKKS